MDEIETESSVFLKAMMFDIARIEKRILDTMPPDLAKALNASLKAKELWSKLTPIAQRDFTTWVVSAKQPETRARRIRRTVEELLEGKKRPCCYSTVPLGLYTALNKTVKGKAQWKELTPDQRRDFSDWIEAGKDRVMQKERVEKVAAALTAGKNLMAIAKVLKQNPLEA